jgi:hypothetical protein
MTMTDTFTAQSATLPEAMLLSFRERAGVLDPTGRFPHEDLADLPSVGWLQAAAPASSGGLVLDLAAFATEQRRLAPRTGHRVGDVPAPLLGGHCRHAPHPSPPRISGTDPDRRDQTGGRTVSRAQGPDVLDNAHERRNCRSGRAEPIRSSDAPLAQSESGGGSNSASSAASGAWKIRSDSSKSARPIG